jgi:hypothetical protein
MTRNDFIFKGNTFNLYRWEKKFKDELALLVHKASRKSYAGLKIWAERFPITIAIMFSFLFFFFLPMVF